MLFDTNFSQNFASTIRGKWGTEDTITLRKFEQYKEWFCLAELTVEKNFVEPFRQIKTESEIKKTQVAATHIDKILQEFLPTLKVGITEKAATHKLENLIRANGKFELSFDAIVAFGSNTANPHHHPGEKTLEKNMPILIDSGAKFAGYCSDMTRNFWFGGSVDPEYKKVYELLLEIQSEANTQFVTDKKIAEIDLWVRKKMGKYEPFFVHSLGHGTGLDIHEAPSLSQKNKDALQTNEIVTNEPGIYIPEKFGIRIEDQLIINKNFSSKNIFTKFDKTLQKI
mgnify:FL=1